MASLLRRLFKCPTHVEAIQNGREFASVAVAIFTLFVSNSGHCDEWLVMAADCRLPASHLQRRVRRVYHAKPEAVVEVYCRIPFQNTQLDRYTSDVCQPLKFTDQMRPDAAALIRRQNLNLHDGPLTCVPKGFEESDFFGPATNYARVVVAIPKTLPMSMLIGGLASAF